MNSYIDATYYTANFKANKNAMITGSFNNVAANQANFEAFALRGSELANRLLNNKIERLGGIDFVSPTPRDFIKKAVACFVQNWFIQGYTMADLNNNLSIGSFSFAQIKNNESLRKMISVDGIINLQATEMWDGIAVGVDIETIQKMGYNLRDILFIDEALQLFQLKGNYDENFHIDINFASELTGQTGLRRWIKIAQTPRRFVSFEIMGGSSNELTKALLMIDKTNFLPTKSDAFMYTQQINGAEVSYWAMSDAENLNIWVAVNDDLPAEQAHFLISNIYADDKGQYKLFGSQTLTTGTEIVKSNILAQADVSAVQTAVNQLIPTVTANSQALAVLQPQVAKIDTVEGKAENAQVTAEFIELQLQQVAADVAANTQNLANEVTRATTAEAARLTNDGSVALLPTFIPTQPTHPTTKSYVDGEITAKLTQNPSISGWEGRWRGALNGTKPTTGTGDALFPLVFNLATLTAQSGTLVYTEGQRVEVTFETAATDDNPEILQARSDNKLNRIEINVGNQFYYKANLATGGILTVYKYNITNNNLVDLPISEVSVTEIYQINGVQTPTDLNMDDAAVVALEGWAY